MRSAPAASGPETLERRTQSYRYGDALDDVTQDVVTLVGFLQRGRVTGVDHHTMREDWHHQRFEISRLGECSPIEIGHGLSGAVQHERAARRNSQRKMVRLARPLDDLQSVVH